MRFFDQDDEIVSICHYSCNSDTFEHFIIYRRGRNGKAIEKRLNFNSRRRRERERERERMMMRSVISKSMRCFSTSSLAYEFDLNGFAVLRNVFDGKAIASRRR